MIQEFLFKIDAQRVTEDLENRVFEADCTDGTLWSSEGEVFIQFARRAPTLAGAVRSAIEDLQGHGVPIAEIVAPHTL